MNVQHIKTIQEALAHIKTQIAREENESPEVIAWDIADLLTVKESEEWERQYPAYKELVDLAADLEVNNKVGYGNAGEMWSRIRVLSEELEKEVAGV